MSYLEVGGGVFGVCGEDAMRMKMVVVVMVLLLPFFDGGGVLEVE